MTVVRASVCAKFSGDRKVFTRTSYAFGTENRNYFNSKITRPAVRGWGGGELLYLLFRAADESGRGVGKVVLPRGSLDPGAFSVRTDIFFGFRYSKTFLNEKSNSSTQSRLCAPR